jgi:titin
VLAAPSGINSVLVSYSTVPDASNGGAPITKYRATCRASGQPDRTGDASGPQFGPITVTGLTPAVVYSCTVEAINIAGPGPESSPATVVPA